MSAIVGVALIVLFGRSQGSSHLIDKTVEF